VLLRWDDTEFARPDGIWWEPSTVTHDTVINDLELGGDVGAWFGASWEQCAHPDFDQCWNPR